MWRLIGAGFALIVLVLAGFVGYRTSTFTAPPAPASVTLPSAGAYPLDVNTAAQHLAEAVRFNTVSLVNTTDDRSNFQRFQAWMITTYPAFHAIAKREVINGLGLLYTWQGSDPAQPPILLLAHQDTVPAPPETRSAWSVDPFAGVVRDGAVWGRGSIDDKGSLVSILEAAEILAQQGKQPKRTIMMAFGFDEEIGGQGGAVQIAAELKRRGVHAWFALDEGSAAITENPLTGGPTSLIGIAEKGFATMRIRAVGQPGHSSIPPRETAISLLAEAVTRVHDMPIRHNVEGGGPAMSMMRALSPSLSFTTRMALANEWLFSPLIKQKLGASPTAQALLGTTVAPTVISGGSRANVLPGEATALINFRIHPRDTSAGLLASARAATANLHGVTIDWVDPPKEASVVSSSTSTSFALIAALSHQALPNAPVAPGLVLAGTNSREYSDVAENVYRFQPILLTNEELETIHGNNERLTVANLERMIRFYAGLMEAGAMQ
ncbi:MAG: M20/M25/M40 family metallo-hydrolase [Terricaulis sp.]